MLKSTHRLQLAKAVILVCAIGLVYGCSAAPMPAPTDRASSPFQPTTPALVQQNNSSANPTRATANTSASPRGENNARVLRIGRGAYPDVLDPQRSSFVNEVAVLQFLYEGLLRLDHKGNIAPGGADTWQISPDGKQITFHIRDGLKRSDGTPILAEDYAYALRRAVDPRVTGKQYTAILYDIKGARALDQLAAQNPATISDAQIERLYQDYGVTVTGPQTLVVTVEKPAAYWLYIASLWVTFPVDRRVVETDPEAWWTKAENHIGNGPFVAQTFAEDNKIIYAANPNYWQGKPTLDRVEEYFNPDNQVTLQAYLNGELDIDANLAPEQIKQVQGDPQLQNDLLRYPAAVMRAIAFNNSSRPFDDLNVRRAFSQAFDREGFVRDVLQGIGKAYTRWIPPGVPGALAEKPGVPATDPLAARKTLAENGYAAADSTPENPKVDCAKLGEIKLTYPSSPVNQARSQFIAGNFVNVFGCPVTLDPVDATVFTALTKNVKTNPQISRQGWVQDYPHPQNWLSTYWVCGSFSRNYGYCNLQLDQILAQADATTDFQEAIRLYQQAEELMLQDVPAAFSNYDEYIYLVRPYVRGPRDYPGSSDASWPGQYGPLWTYDIDLANVPANYPTQ